MKFFTFFSEVCHAFMNPRKKSTSFAKGTYHIPPTPPILILLQWSFEWIIPKCKQIFIFSPLQAVKFVTSNEVCLLSLWISTTKPTSPVKGRGHIPAPSQIPFKFTRIIPKCSNCNNVLTGVLNQFHLPKGEVASPPRVLSLYVFKTIDLLEHGYLYGILGSNPIFFVDIFVQIGVSSKRFLPML